MKIVVYHTTVTADACWRMGSYVLIEDGLPIKRESVKVNYDRDFPTDVSELEELISKRTGINTLIRI